LTTQMAGPMILGGDVGEYITGNSARSGRKQRYHVVMLRRRCRFSIHTF